MEFDAFGFYEFFFLFNSFKETFERVGNTNCILMFCPDISCFFFFFFIFTDETIQQRSVRIRIEELFFSHGSSKFFCTKCVQSCTSVRILRKTLTIRVKSV